MAHDMRRKTIRMKADMKKVNEEAYECLAKERKKVKNECHIRKIQTSVAEISRGASRDLIMCPCINWKE